MDGKGQGSGGLGVACYGERTSSRVGGAVVGFPSRHGMARFVCFRQTTLVIAEDGPEGEISVHDEGYSNISRSLKSENAVRVREKMDLRTSKLPPSCPFSNSLGIFSQAV